MIVRLYFKQVIKILMIVRNMGLRYIVFRLYYEFLKRSSLMIALYPTKFKKRSFVTLCSFRNNKNELFSSKSVVAQFQLNNYDKTELDSNAKKIVKGEIPFFNGCWRPLRNWHINPINGYEFSKFHWTMIHELNREQGDIKYVWEKSRFCYLITLLRDDEHNGVDHSKFIFDLIGDWIRENPLNCGPNYICSQEISLRLLNWIIALHYYKASDNLNDENFSSIINSIYWQTKHVEKNSAFARIAVRNNHAITEALCLYAVGTLFEFFPESLKWKKTGKARLEEECLYQFGVDGSYVQNSHNYHRVVVQLYTYALTIANVNKDKFSGDVITRLTATIKLLFTMQDSDNGRLPNYGHNDGSLFFPLSMCNYRDYRPQLNALYAALTGNKLYGDGKWDEDRYWFGFKIDQKLPEMKIRDGIHSFSEGGYHILRSNGTTTIIRCVTHRNRPAHADNLHIDISVNGHNILCDRGSFSYNTTEESLAQYLNSSVHNTVSLIDGEQMLKGPRFTWYNSTKVNGPVKISESSSLLEWCGSITGFFHVKKGGVIHHRNVRYFIAKSFWEITDTVKNWDGPIKQAWNIRSEFKKMGFTIHSVTTSGQSIEAQELEGTYSETYGTAEKIRQIVFITKEKSLITTIKKAHNL